MAASPEILQLELRREIFPAKYSLSGPIKRIQSTGEVHQRTSLHLATMSFMRLAAARWQDSMSRGQKC